MRLLRLIIGLLFLSGLSLAQTVIPISTCSTVDATGKPVPSSRSGFPASNAFDGKLDTWWQASVGIQALRCDLGSARTIDSVYVAAFRGAQRATAYNVDVSPDGFVWNRVLIRYTSDQLTDGFLRLSFTRQAVRYVQITAYGGREGTQTTPAAISEVQFRTLNDNIGYFAGTIVAPVPSVQQVVAVDPTTVSFAANNALYYVDCQSGNDSNTGTSVEAAWRTPAKAQASFPWTAGNGLYFRSGCRWEGRLTVGGSGTSTNPIVVGSYGPGNLPIIANNERTNGREDAVRIENRSHVVIDHLALTQAASNEPPAFNPLTFDTRYSQIPDDRTYTQNCQTPTGYRVGVGIYGSSNNITVQYNDIYRHSSGIALGVAGGGFNRILHNTIRDQYIVQKSSPPIHYKVDQDIGITGRAAHEYENIYDDTTAFWDDDSGAMGIVVNNNDNEIAFNTFSNNNAPCSEDYGVEGADLEIYGESSTRTASRNFIHHNISLNSGTFMESGGIAVHNTFAYNIFAPLSAAAQKAGEFLVMRGTGGGAFGGQAGAQFYNNTAWGVQVGVACVNACKGDTLTFRNNVVVGAAVPRINDGYSCLYYKNCFKTDGVTPQTSQKAEFYADCFNSDASTDGSKEDCPRTGNNRIARLDANNNAQWTPSTVDNTRENSGRQSTDTKMTISQRDSTFENPSQFDFRPRVGASSAIIDQGRLTALTITRVINGSGGTTTSTITTDVYGKPTPREGTAPDIGASESQ